MLTNSNYMIIVMLPTLLLSMYAQWKVRSAFALFACVMVQESVPRLAVNTYMVAPYSSVAALAVFGSNVTTD